MPTTISHFRNGGDNETADLLETMVYKQIDFEEFCAAAISVYHLEALENWGEIASAAFENFDREGNRVISVEELAHEQNLGPTAYALLKDWLRTG
ncbi:PREDICTED: CDPK-related kinase 4-like [Ipomoea nil]|uniref:CDPK-related kinase 4-like n=1 Tax=Ipomoea nil TaxID=35883 RepID=UPI0009016715|nr:PREDICTED: CDPK-related kinase 4-like [Ipomoea nil]